MKIGDWQDLEFKDKVMDLYIRGSKYLQGHSQDCLTVYVPRIINHNEDWAVRPKRSPETPYIDSECGPLRILEETHRLLGELAERFDESESRRKELQQRCSILGQRVRELEGRMR